MKLFIEKKKKINKKRSFPNKDIQIINKKSEIKKTKHTVNF